MISSIKLMFVLSLFHSPLKFLSDIPWFVYLFLVIIALLLFLLIRKHGLKLDIDTWFGKIKFPLYKSNKNTIDMCELCKINVITLVSHITNLCDKIYKIRQKCVNEQLRQMDNQFIVEASWVNDCHTQMISEKIKSMGNSISEEEKIKLLMKNGQILNYIWLIKKQEMYDFLKNIILLNHYDNLNSTELRFFVAEKTEILLAFLEGGPNLYPDWDDSSLLFKREEYKDLITKKARPRVLERIQQLLEKCQIIQKNYNDEINKIEKEKNTITEDFKKSLPPNRRE